jgi:tetratricopeptide (TPR) repeat protein
MKAQFVGRQAELKQIRALRDQGPQRVLVSVFGEGGVGKTTLATKAIAEVEDLAREDLVAALVDFDLPRNRTRHAVRQAIADAFGGDGFREYWAAVRDLEEIEALRASLFVRGRAARRADTAFGSALRDASLSCRLLLVLDTVERIQDDVMFDDLLDLLRLLDNVVVLVVGRHNESIESDLVQVYDHFHSLPVEPLDPIPSEEYLRAVLATDVDKEIAEKVCLLAAGRPILLDLATTWLDREFLRRGLLERPDEWPARSLLQVPMQDIQANLNGYRERFESEVVDGVRTLSSPLDWAVLNMSLLEHQCSAELWQHVLGVTADAAQQLMKDLEMLFFVRADYTLHDEMRRLLSHHVWPDVDPQGSMRQATLKRLLAFVAANRVEKPGWPRWFQQAEELHYRLSLDVNEGYRRFLAEFNQARDNHWTSACQLLVQTIRRPQHWTQLTPQMQLEVSVHEVQLFTFIGQEERMERECQRILEDVQTSDEAKVEALCNIAYGLRDFDPERSANYYEQALTLVSERGDRAGMARIQNLAGQVYRRLGQMDRAIEYFESSIELSQELEARVQMASAQNNLAYVYRQLGDMDRAITLARKASVAREREHDQLGMAYSYQTIGEIYRDRNELIDAEAQFLDAREIFVRLDAEDAVARVDIALANLCRKRRQPDLIERYLDESLTIFGRMRNEEGRAQALNEYGCEFRRRGRESSLALEDHAKASEQFQQAREYLDESTVISERMGNWYRMADNLADLSLLYLYVLENCPMEDREARLKWKFEARKAAGDAIRVARQHGFRLPENRALECLGDLYYGQGDYFRAYATYYMLACLDMAEYYGTSLWRYHSVFDRVHRRLLSISIPEEQVRYIARYMLRRWREEGLEAVVPGFVTRYVDLAQG